MAIVVDERQDITEPKQKKRKYKKKRDDIDDIFDF